MSERESGSDGNEGSGSKPVAIKIASKDPAQRNSAGGADPGPGDMNAAPSEAPQLLDIPEPPTASQLVVKSTGSQQAPSAIGGAGSSKRINTLNAPRSGTSMGAKSHKSHKSSASLAASGSQAGPAASNPSQAEAGKEPTSSKPLTGPSENMSQASKSGAGGSTAGSGGPGPSATMPDGSVSPGPKMSPGGASGASDVHDEDEEGEGVLETAGSPAGSTPASSPKSAKSSAGGSSPKSTTGAGSASANFGASGPKSSAVMGSSAGGGPKSGRSSADKSGGGPLSMSALRGAAQASSSNVADGKSSKKDDKKVTRFRYHKRITVRTHGKTNPSAVMSKVNKGLTPSTIDELDPKELMKRAGIKNTKHWRIRLRQTKRITKNGKTTTQTKVAYRDSSGNKVVPTCKKCGKKMDQCNCDKPEPDH